ncbi:MAG TPA: glycosyltransferase family 39 protein [Acidobacteriaceae bacterium]|jgi:4-amino-4-deoxy-L-arabinose transferase-like glycosyltransferase|nr:glycosyltransferase family 39 protein [Acidobacteriaceae bacterium]
MSTLVIPQVERAELHVHPSPRRKQLYFLVALWVVVFFASLWTPPVLDDADGTHANAARQMALSGDYVTLRVNNVRYLEKAPLPYWIAAASIRIFGVNAFAVHLPQAVAVLLLMLLGYRWASESYGERAALYTGLAVLTSAGVFLFTRVFIPDILLSFLLAAALYCFLKSIAAFNSRTVILRVAKNPGRFAASKRSGAPSLRSKGGINEALYPYALWAAVALAVLTKGLVALVFLFGPAIIYLAFTGEYRNWRAFKPGTGLLLFLAIAAPWHILAGARNTGGVNGHGFFWFYFINEHVLRFLGRRIPRDYNKLPGYLYWSLHLVWLFPWSLFAPVALVSAKNHWRRHSDSIRSNGRHSDMARSRGSESPYSTFIWRRLPAFQPTTLLLTIFASFVLLFFAFSTNQEYYTYPVYLPLLMLTAAAIARAEELNPYLPASSNYQTARTFTFAHAAFTMLGLAIAAALSYGLWVSRHLTAVPDVGDFVAHRGVGDYTLSMSSLFDLTGPSFAALRLPASLAFIAFALGPAIAWVLRARRRHLASTITVALTSALFLIAAHIAFGRFATMMSSQNFAARIQQLEASRQIAPNSTILLYGDQAYGSSIPYYLNRPLSQPALLVDGRSSSMWFGSTFPDAQHYFLTPQQLLAQWGTGPRKILFVPINHRDDVDRLLGSRQVRLAESSGKALITDRPLNTATIR